MASTHERRSHGSQQYSGDSARRGFRLPLEPRNLIGVSTGFRQRLQRNMAIELKVFGKVDVSHPTLADFANDSVTSNGSGRPCAPAEIRRSIPVREISGCRATMCARLLRCAKMHRFRDLTLRLQRNLDCRIMFQMDSEIGRLVAAIEGVRGLIVVLTGAGISLASGIPTLRSSDPGAIWAKVGYRETRKE